MQCVVFFFFLSITPAAVIELWRSVRGSNRSVQRVVFFFVHNANGCDRALEELSSAVTTKSVVTAGLVSDGSATETVLEIVLVPHMNRGSRMLVLSAGKRP